MSKSTSLLVSFNQAVELLMLLARATKGKSLDTFRFLLPDQNSLLLGENGSSLSIYFLPEETSRYSNKDQKQLRITLERWADENQINLRGDLPGDFDRSLSVEQFILYVLFASGSPLPTRVQDQVLVLTPFEDQDELAAMLQTLALNATYTRVAVTDQLLGRKNAFFWIKDDESRGSSFQSLLDGNYFTSARVLKEYSDGVFSVFLPENLEWKGSVLRPTAEGIRLLARFFQEAPLLYGTDEQKSAPSNLMAAIIPLEASVSGATDLKLFDLRALVFVNQSELVFRANDFCKVQVIPIQNDPELVGENLRKAILNADPVVGYPLYLRDTGMRLRYTEVIDQVGYEREIEGIVRQINNLQYRLAFLHSVSEHKPLLMRFTQSQLPALADYLRTLSPRRLAEGSLLYAYHATEQVPEGYHYLFLPAEILAEADITPLYAWPNLEEKRVFWLDPFWARYYPEAANNCYVFVPYEMALFPSMHNWEEQDMDVYLRDMLQMWATEENNATIAADIPMYIFDPVPERASASQAYQDMNIFVLDLRDFSDLKINLPWMNDNLVLHQELSNREFIRAMADSKTKEMMLQNQLNTEKELLAQIERTKQRMLTGLNAILNDLAEAVATQLNHVNSAAVENTRKAAGLSQQLRAIELEYAAITQLIIDTEKSQGAFKTEADGKLKETMAVQEKIRQAIEATEKTDLAMQTATNQVINRLDTEETKQRSRLANIRIGW